MDVPQWRDIITDTNRKGIDYDRKLFAMSLNVNDQWVKFHAGLREEARLVSKEYPRQLSGLSLSKLLPFTDTDEISL